MKLSIIIPFYNVEKYIAECLDSLFAQDIPETEYEVICVNDCSPDGSRAIVLDYQNKHKNLVLIEHETNKMLGAARNTGLRAAKGKYVWFIDSDDYIEKNVLGKLISTAEMNELEILQFNIQRVNDSGELFKIAIYPNDIEIISGKSFCENFLFDFWALNACNRIYNKNILIKNQLYYPEGVYYEDSAHSIKALLLATKFGYSNKDIYFYRDNPQSIMNTRHESGAKLADRVLLNVDSINAVNKLVEDDILLKKKLIYAHIWALKKFRKKILKFSKIERLKFYNRIEYLQIDFSICKDYMKWHENMFYLNPNIIKPILSILNPLIKVLYYIKKLHDK